MNWVPDSTMEFITWLRATVNSIWLLCGFIVAMGALYLTMRATWRIVQWLDSVLFANPW